MCDKGRFVSVDLEVVERVPRCSASVARTALPEFDFKLPVAVVVTREMLGGTHDERLPLTVSRARHVNRLVFLAVAISFFLPSIFLNLFLSFFTSVFHLCARPPARPPV